MTEEYSALETTKTLMRAIFVYGAFAIFIILTVNHITKFGFMPSILLILLVILTLFGCLFATWEVYDVLRHDMLTGAVQIEELVSMYDQEEYHDQLMMARSELTNVLIKKTNIPTEVISEIKPFVG